MQEQLPRIHPCTLKAGIHAGYTSDTLAAPKILGGSLRFPRIQVIEFLGALHLWVRSYSKI